MFLKISIFGYFIYDLFLVKNKIINVLEMIYKVFLDNNSSFFDVEMHLKPSGFYSGTAGLNRVKSTRLKVEDDEYIVFN
jgi:hypothetical protein